MREQTEHCIVTFPTTTAAMAMERQAKQTGTPGRLIPTPTVITAACGLAWMAPCPAQPQVEALLQESGIPYEQIRVLKL
jgi:hypothetical protein